MSELLGDPSQRTCPHPRSPLHPPQQHHMPAMSICHGCATGTDKDFILAGALKTMLAIGLRHGERP